jgi:hypothetical protein
VQLRDVMPFTSIRVKMHLQVLYECGAKFYFEFFAVGEDGGGRREEKIAFSSRRIAFIGAQGSSDAVAWPESFLSDMKRYVPQL